jgi:DNA mismatch endonuclease, patch repair protein
MIGLSCSVQKPPNMTDVHDPKTRSYNMNRIKGKDTKPEMVVRKFLFANGFRYRLHDKKLPGKPDIVLPKYRTVIFVHGCFWHGHEGCRYFKMPQTNTAFWEQKIERNKEVDLQSHNELINNGYTVIVIWECQLKADKSDNSLAELLKLFENMHPI